MFRNANALQGHAQCLTFYVTQITLFFPPSKACLGLFVLQNPEGIEPFAGTIQLNPASGMRPASAMSAPPPPSFLPLARMEGRLPGQATASCPFWLPPPKGQRWARRASLAQESYHGGVISMTQVGRQRRGWSLRSPFSCTLGDPRADLKFLSAGNYSLLFSGSHQLYFCGVGESSNAHGLSWVL